MPWPGASRDGRGTPDPRPAPCLSVIMPAHNARAFIGTAIGSLFGQTRRDFEVIVIDDGSTDGTADVVTALASARHETSPEVRLLRQSRTGAGGARNAGIAAARSELIGFLDADDRWEPRMVVRQVGRFAADAAIDLCCTGFRHVDERGEPVAGAVFRPPPVIDVSSLLRMNTIHTSTVVMRRETCRRVGGFDAELPTHEDHDLWLRVAALRPGNIASIPDCLCDYRLWRGQSSADWRRMHEGWMRVIAKRTAEVPAAWASSVGVAAANHLDYCASLAYAAGDVRSMRRLVLRSWMARGWRLLARPHAGLFMTVVAALTCLPDPVGRRAVGVLEHARTAWRQARFNGASQSRRAIR